MIARVVLLILALYAALLGLLFLFVQDLAATTLEIAIADPIAVRQWGASLFVLALLAALLASDPIRYRPLLVVPLVGLVLPSLVLVYELAVGTTGFRQAGGPLIINAVLFVLLVVFYPRGQAASASTGASASQAERPA